MRRAGHRDRPLRVRCVGEVAEAGCGGSRLGWSWVVGGGCMRRAGTETGPCGCVVRVRWRRWEVGVRRESSIDSGRCATLGMQRLLRGCRR